MRMVLIAVIALLVIGGGGAGAYFYFMNPAQASAGKEAKKGAEAAEHAVKEHKAVEYVKLDPLIFPVIDKEGVTQVISLVVAIEVEDKEHTETVKMLVPRLTDAFIQDMYGSLGTKGMKDGVIQTHIIKERLNKISQKVLGGGIKSDVLLQVVQQRPA
jgi:flagellar protein FliL